MALQHPKKKKSFQYKQGFGPQRYSIFCRIGCSGLFRCFTVLVTGSLANQYFFCAHQYDSRTLALRGSGFLNSEPHLDGELLLIEHHVWGVYFWQPYFS